MCHPTINKIADGEDFESHTITADRLLAESDERVQKKVPTTELERKHLSKMQ
jgi:hypothetical protein